MAGLASGCADLVLDDIPRNATGLGEYLRSRPEADFLALALISPVMSLSRFSSSDLHGGGVGLGQFLGVAFLFIFGHRTNFGHPAIEDGLQALGQAQGVHFLTKQANVNVEVGVLSGFGDGDGLMLIGVSDMYRYLLVR